MKRVLYGIAYPGGDLVVTCGLYATKTKAEMVAESRYRNPEHRKHGPYQVVKLKYKLKEH